MISIIIPVYNTGKVFNKCLTSVLKQTYKDWECIIVNDCSTEIETINVLEQWKSQPSKFIFIDKKINEGVDKARFTALSMAKGDFVFFMDSDDWIELNALETLMSKAKETDADLVVGRMCKQYWGVFYERKSWPPKEWMERIITHEELMEKYYVSFFGVNILPIPLCAGLYKKKLFDEAKVQPSGIKFGEDLVVNMRLFPFIRKYYAVNQVIYYYRIGLPGSADKKYLDSWLDSLRQLYELKMDALDKVHDEKAFFSQNVELVNYLKTHVTNCIRDRKRNRTEDIVRLQAVLDNSICKNIKSLQGSSYEDTESVVRLGNADAEGFYEMMELRFKNLPFIERTINLCVPIIKSLCVKLKSIV